MLWRLAQQLGDAVKKAEVAYRQSLYFSSTSNYAEARRCATMALRFFQEGESISGEVDAKVQLAHLDHWHAGKGEKAKRLLAEALEQPEAHDLHRCKGIVLSELGILAAVTGRTEEAAAFWKMGLAAAEAANARRLRAGMLSNLGRLYTESGQISQAEVILRQALEESRRIGARKS